MVNKICLDKTKDIFAKREKHLLSQKKHHDIETEMVKSVVFCLKQTDVFGIGRFSPEKETKIIDSHIDKRLDLVNSFWNRRFDNYKSLIFIPMILFSFAFLLMLSSVWLQKRLAYFAGAILLFEIIYLILFRLFGLRLYQKWALEDLRNYFFLELQNKGELWVVQSERSLNLFGQCVENKIRIKVRYMLEFPRL